MSIINIYSKRKKLERGEFPDVYQYTKIPYALRVQIIHIWTAVYGEPARWNKVNELFRMIHDGLCREYGVFSLSKQSSTPFEAVANFTLQTPLTEQFLDVLELTFRAIDMIVRQNPNDYSGTEKPDDAIAELNGRFREHGVGFQYESGRIIRVDSEIVHDQVVKPALRFLCEKEFKGANQEFLSAHEHYRNRKYKECLNECLKAFESTMKSICSKRNWSQKPTDTAKPLIDILFQNQLIPAFLQSHFSGLRSTLEAGIPTVRNKLAGHGQGLVEIEVPEHLASYALHLTATNILLLAQADKALK